VDFPAFWYIVSRKIWQPLFCGSAIGGSGVDLMKTVPAEIYGKTKILPDV
jgi:hypothetical protein